MREKTIRVDPAKLRQARGDKKSTDLARALDISKQRMWNYENGIRDIPESVLRQICKKCCVSVASVLPENN